MVKIKMLDSTKCCMYIHYDCVLFVKSITWLIISENILATCSKVSYAQTL